MGKVNSIIDISKIEELTELVRVMSPYLKELTANFNGKIQFDENILSQTFDVTFKGANQDQILVHNLNKVGVNFIVVNKNVSCDIYHGTKDDTNNSIYLRSTVANAQVKLILI